MKTSNMKILIVGGGIGGLTLAAFLQNSDIEYEIVEKAPNWGQQGYLIGFWDNGRDILRKLGIAEKFDAAGSRMAFYSIRDGRGRILRNYNLSDFYKNYGTALTFIPRADLHNWLLEKMDPSKIIMGFSVEKIVQEPDGVIVNFTDGRTNKYDLVVGADGVHSVVRSLVFKNGTEKYENWRVWFSWVDNKFDVPASFTEYVEPNQFIAIISVGRKTLAWLIAPAKHEIWDSTEGRIKRLEKLFGNEVALVPNIFQKLQEKDFLPTDLLEIRLQKWLDGCVVLLGDAAHCFGPHAALGGSMAMEDAYVLAAELMKVSKSYSLQIALMNYQAKRKQRVAIARRVTNKFRMFTLVKSKILRKLINFFTPYIPDNYFVRDYNQLLKQEI